MELEHKRIAARIKQARLEKGLRQHQLAALLGVIPRTYQNYESESKPRIPWDRMNDIARITERKVEWLLHGETPDVLESLNGNQAVILNRLDQIRDELVRLTQTVLKRDEAAKPGQVPDRLPLGEDRRQDAQAEGEPGTETGG